MPLLIANCQSTTWSMVSVVICHFIFVRALIAKRPNDPMCNSWRCWRIWKLGDSLQAHFFFFLCLFALINWLARHVLSPQEFHVIAMLSVSCDNFFFWNEKKKTKRPPSKKILRSATSVLIVALRTIALFAARRRDECACSLPILCGFTGHGQLSNVPHIYPRFAYTAPLTYFALLFRMNRIHCYRVRSRREKLLYAIHSRQSSEAREMEMRNSVDRFHLLCVVLHS